MTNYGYLLYGLIISIAVILILANIIIIIGKSILKELNKHIIIRSVLLIFSGFLIFYLIFYAGEYTKQKISNDTVDRLLNLSTESINMKLFRVPEYAYAKDDYEFDFELKDSSIMGSVSISQYEDETITLLYGEHLSRTFTDDNSYVYVAARSANRDFSKVPLIQNYLSTIYIINNNLLIEITYSELKNDPQTIDMILDCILK